MIHLVYPHRDRISAPDVIGATLATALRAVDDVRTYEVDSFERIRPARGDILLGHAYQFAPTVFRRSVHQPGWARRILLQPYNGDWEQVGFLDGVIDHCDLFLTITGRYWFDRIPTTYAARWFPKMVHVDLAVDRDNFPQVKRNFAPAGQRRILYIGNDHPGKNIPYLSSIARQWGGGTIDWAGRGAPAPHLRQLGFVDFASPAGRVLIADYDFLITAGSADANPTTVLEAMSWGLIPICTPTSGYEDEPGIVNIPPADVAATCAVLDKLQNADDAALTALRQAGEERLTTHFTWQRFVNQVIGAIRSDAAPLISPHQPGTPRGGPRSTARFAAKLVGKNAAYRIDRHLPGAAETLRRLVGSLR